ncbi:MAG: PAS domain-containing protein, partial [Clostridiales bacterium]|nr:PAS domain-containing protein [Clostridiales bacterium]
MNKLIIGYNRRERERLSNILDSTGISQRVIEFGGIGNLFANRSLLVEFGELSEARGRDIWDSDVPAEMERLDGGVVRTVVFSPKLNKWFHCFTSQIEWDGIKNAFLEAYVDITSAKLAEKKMRSNDALVKYMSDMAFIIGGEQKILHMNNTASVLTGYSERELTKLGQIFEINDAVLKSVSSSGSTWQGNAEIKTKDKRTLSVLASVFTIPRTSEDDEITYGVLMRNITESALIQKSLNIHQKMLNSVNMFIMA